MIKTSLRYFMSVARCGSIRAASNELNVAQSAVSRQLQSLEYEVGAPLFERRPRGVVLTHAGRLLFEFGRDAVFNLDRLQSEFDALQGLRRGHVKIAAIESMVPRILPRVIDRYLSQYPGINIAVDVTTSDQVSKLVQEGEADIGIVFSLNVAPDLTVRFQSRQPLLAIMSADHPLAEFDEITMNELTRWPIALAPLMSGARIVFDEACRASNIVIKPVLETNSVELMRRFALQGTGVTILLRPTVAGSLEDAKLKAVPFRDELFCGTVNVLTWTDRKLPLAAEKFLSYLGEELSKP